MAKVNKKERKTINCKNAQVFLITNHSNPKYASWIQSRTIIVNFHITLPFLEAKLMDLVFESMDPLSNAKASSLRVLLAMDKERFNLLEYNLLIRISKCDGSLLEQSVWTFLNCTHNEKSEINSKLSIQEKTLMSIEVNRMKFQKIARKAANLFFILMEMSLMNTFYQYTLKGLMNTFSKILESVQTSLSFNQLSSKIAALLNKRIYEVESMGMLQLDKLLFSFRIAIEADHFEERICLKDVEFLLKPSNNQKDLNLKNFFGNEKCYNIHLLTIMFPGNLGTLESYFRKNEKEWNIWYHDSNPEKISCPCSVLNEFQVQS